MVCTHMTVLSTTPCRRCSSCLNPSLSPTLSARISLFLSMIQMCAPVPKEHFHSVVVTSTPPPPQLSSWPSSPSPPRIPTSATTSGATRTTYVSPVPFRACFETPTRPRLRDRVSDVPKTPPFPDRLLFHSFHARHSSSPSSSTPTAA
jgi:hypothetical protein